MDRKAEGWAERLGEGEKASTAGRRSVTLAAVDEESAGPSSGTSSSSSLSVRPTRRLLRVMVVDYPTGIALFQHIWSWKGDPNVPGVAKVIVALYKLSQSLGGRGEGRRRSQQDLYSLKSKRASGGAGLRPMMPSPRPRKPRIRCVFSKTEHVVVGLFHEIGDTLELPKQCGDAILREFAGQYGNKLASMRHIFEDMIDEKKVRDCAMTQEQVLENFADFENNLNSIEEVIEFNRVRSAKESSSAGTYTFSFSLTDDTVELIKRERQKQKEEDEQREREKGEGGGGEAPRQRSSLASSSGPSAASASEAESEDSMRADDDSSTRDDDSDSVPSSARECTTPDVREKKRERKNSKEKKDKKEREKEKEKKKKKKDKKDKARTDKDLKKVKEKELKKMLASV